MDRDVQVGTRVVRTPSTRVDYRLGTCWQGLLAVLAGWCALWVALVAVDSAEDPSAGSALVVAISIVAVGLSAIVAGLRLTLATAGSPMRHVFRCSPHFWISTALTAVSLGAVVLLARRSPFDGLVAHGLPLADLLVALSWIAGAAVCAIGSGIAITRAVAAHRDERTWWRFSGGPDHRG